MRSRKWDGKELKAAVVSSRSIRQVLQKLGLAAAGGNYVQIQSAIREYALDVSHFTGKGWSRGRLIPREPVFPIQALLVKNGTFQSHKLKKRLFSEGIKKPQCELCGWSKKAPDGRLPLELDHINGDRFDNRLENLRILCPNCHSLQPTHRGRNMGRRDGGIGIRATLKMS
jgi:hypothetical protein